MLLQGARDHHGGVRRGDRSRLSPAQYARRDPAPLAALPVETLHCNHGLLAGKPRKKRKQRRSQAVVMDDVVIRRHGMRRAQQSVDDSFQMLGANGWQTPHAHAVVRVHGRSEIAAAIYGDFMSQAGQFVASLLVIRLDAAVLRNHAAAPDEGDTNTAAWAGLLRRGGGGQTSLGGGEPVVEFEQLLHVLIGIVVCFHATSGCGAHLVDQIRTVKQKSDGMS